jgi:hypothetical protein
MEENKLDDSAALKCTTCFSTSPKGRSGNQIWSEVDSGQDIYLICASCSQALCRGTAKIVLHPRLGIRLLRKNISPWHKDTAVLDIVTVDTTTTTEQFVLGIATSHVVTTSRRVLPRLSPQASALAFDAATLLRQYQGQAPLDPSYERDVIIAPSLLTNQYLQVGNGAFLTRSLCAGTLLGRYGGPTPEFVAKATLTATTCEHVLSFLLAGTMVYARCEDHWTGKIQNQWTRHNCCFNAQGYIVLLVDITASAEAPVELTAKYDKDYWINAIWGVDVDHIAEEKQVKYKRLCQILVPDSLDDLTPVEVAEHHTFWQRRAKKMHRKALTTTYTTAQTQHALATTAAATATEDVTRATQAASVALAHLETTLSTMQLAKDQLDQVDNG